MLGAGVTLASDARQKQATVELPPGITLHLSAPAKNGEERNSAVQSYHQLGINSPREHALQVLTEQVRRWRGRSWRAPAFRERH